MVGSNNWKELLKLECDCEHSSGIAVSVDDAPDIFDAPLSLTLACAPACFRQSYTQRQAQSCLSRGTDSDAQERSRLTRYPQLMTTLSRGLASLRRAAHHSRSLHLPTHGTAIARPFTTQTSRHAEGSGPPDFKNIKFPSFPLGIAPKAKSACLL